MPDREKVIKGLECCKTYASCNECPYDGTEQSCNSLRREALTLIKEQQELIDADKEELKKERDELAKELNDVVELIRKKDKKVRLLIQDGHITPLKKQEQETVKPKKVKGYKPPMYTIYEYECPECESLMLYKQPFCAGCGRTVKWE